MYFNFWNISFVGRVEKREEKLLIQLCDLNKKLNKNAVCIVIVLYKSNFCEFLFMCVLHCYDI